MGYHEVEDTTGDAVKTHQEVIDEFRKQVNYGVQQRTVCAVTMDPDYDTDRQISLFTKIHDVETISLDQIRSYLQGLTALEAISITKDQLPAYAAPMFVTMTDRDFLDCQSRIDYLCEFTGTKHSDVVILKWCDPATTMLKSKMVFDSSTMHDVSPAAVTLPPLPPVRVQDDLPPPSPAFQASVSRWCDFDGED